MATIKSELDYIQEARSQLAEALITKFGVRRYDNAKDNPTLKGLWTVKADGSADKLKRLYDWALLVTGTNVHTDASLTFKNDGKGDAAGTTFNGSVARSISYNSIGAAASNHVHKNLIIKWGAGDTEGTNLFTYNGSTEKTINLSVPFSLLFTNFSNAGSLTTRITIGGVTKDLKVDADTVDGLHANSFVRSYNSSEISGNLKGNYLGMTTSSGITSDWWHILCGAWNDEFRWNSLLALPTLNRRGLYYRSGLDNNTAFGSWIRIADADGTGASGTWNINISGNANTATNANQLDGYHESSFYRHRGNYGKSYTDVSTEYNLGPGTYITLESGYSGTLLSFNSGGSASAIQFWTHYLQGYLYYRTSVDSNRWYKTNGEWTRILDSDNYSSILDNRYYTETEADNRFVNITGDTMTGLLITTLGSSHSGIKVGNTYINAINGDLIFQNNSAIRFGGDSWDYNVWAGLKYVHSSKTIYLGLADNSAFTANSAQSGGKLYLPGIVNIYTGNGTNLVWHAGNDGSGSGLDADMTDGLHVHSSRNNEANKIVRTDGSGYILAGWINTTSGDMGTTAATRVYCSDDAYIRYKTLANFSSDIAGQLYWANVKVSTSSNAATSPIFGSLWINNSHFFKLSGTTFTCQGGTTFTLPSSSLNTNTALLWTTASDGNRDTGIFYNSSDFAFIANSNDHGAVFAVYDTDVTQDFEAGAREISVPGAGGALWARGGFSKNGSSDSYVLLGGGGHKAISDFSMSHSHPYLPLAGGNMTGSITTPGNDSVVIKPAKNNYDQIGGEGQVFWKIWATNFYGTFHGSCDGNAATATNADTVDGYHADAFIKRGGDDVTGHYTFRGRVFGYNYNNLGSNVAAFIWDKPGSYYTGVGANGSTDTILFSACNVDGTWVDYKQYWVFKGDVTASNFYSSSDIRLKNNINNISKSIRSFNWKESGLKSYGLIAQEIENEYPELVSNNDNGYKSINYTSALCMIIARLENELDELRDKTKLLELQLKMINDYGRC